ncbi:Glyoxal oxidase N-terminus [Albimonas donghaensis]|uniref:Glyoxal oxidase N-terminus n=1 Tax=Albimonas donghaensis TaxID=356660 RepID=A0A1H3CVM4_9RHOB|nr:galactose oxidase early set domain-containing protein [Albimonas donghaensis]SDX58100.1 Glyoxal oxidase N-terminus [Albimonas donghaensis]
MTIDSGTIDSGLPGEWLPLDDWPLISIHVILTAEQELLTFGTDELGMQGGEQHYAVWSFETGSGQLLEHTTATDIFCSIVTTLGSTGELLIVGGDARPLGRPNKGITDVTAFDPETHELYTHPAGEMHYARFYASALTLPTGDVYILGGADAHYLRAPHAEVYSAEEGATLFENSGLFEGEQANNRWWYPKLYMNEAGKLIGWYNYRPEVYDFAWEEDLPAKEIGLLPFISDNSSPAILFDVDKVLTIDLKGKLWVVDISGDSVSFEKIGALFEPIEGMRAWSNFAVLPNGSVLITGGNDRPNEDESFEKFTYDAVTFDPDTGELTRSDPEDLPRLYHSSSILLPDGSVYSLGGGAPGPYTNLNAQRFNPEYLFDDGGALIEDKIEILEAPTHISAGDVFTFSVDRPLDVSRVTFIKHGSATHSIDVETRFVDLDFFVREDGSIVAKLPDSTSLLTPGPYMLFALDANETPSVAVSMRLDMAEASEGDLFSHLILDDPALDALFDAPELIVDGRAAGVMPAEPADPADDPGAAEVSEDGTAITLTGNAWKSVGIRQHITADTRLRLDVKAPDVGEFFGLALENDGVIDRGNMLVLGGAQNVNRIADRFSYTAGGGVQSYDIALGDYFAGETFSRLVLIADDDDDASSDVTFSNIRFLDGEEMLLNGAPVELRSFDEEQDAGSAVISGDGTSVTITGNGWKRLALDAPIGEDDWLSFDFSSTDVGEIIGVAIDGDNEMTMESIISLGGSSANSSFVNTHRNYNPGRGTVHYDIHVGALSPTWEDDLVFVVDDDRDGSGNATFSNITLESRQLFDLQGQMTPVLSYAPRQDEGVAELAAGATRLTLSGNAWKSMALPGAIGPDTWLSFDVTSDDVGEMLAVGFDDDGVLNNLQKVFQLAGEPTIDVSTDFNTYVEGSGARHYAIRLGDYALGAPDRIVFAADDDADGSASATFSNIRLLEGPPVEVDGVVCGVFTHAGTGDQGAATPGDEGREVTLTGNAWKRIEVDATIGADTVLAFEMSSDDLGELTAVGFDTDTSLSTGKLFRLGGSDGSLVGLAGETLYTGDGDMQRIEIAVGEAYAGTFANLVLGADDDEDGSGAATFRDIEILNPDDTLTSHGGTQDSAGARAFATASGVRLDGNTWKSVRFDAFEVDADSVLRFEFRSDVEGEIMGVGLDNDDALSQWRFWQIAGTQDWGRGTHDDQYAIGEGWEYFEIALSEISGTFDRLVLAADDDAGTGVEAYFRNVAIEGVGAANDVIELI